MSRIYDALKLAERERAQSKQAELLGKLSSSLPSMNVKEESTFPPDVTGNVEPQSDFLIGEQVSSPFGNKATLEALPSSIVPIQATVWTPEWSQLPSTSIRGPLLEQFRALRTRVHELRSTAPLKSVMVGSGLPQEGKSFVTLNLALALASSKGSRVLLIDGDMRRASLHKILGARVQPGLSDFLAGKATLDEIFQRGVPGEDQPNFPSAFASLTFIGAGGHTLKAADLSGTRRFEELLRLVGPYYEWIIVDSSPVNLVADSVSLARACDGVLFIVRSGRTRLEFAKRALDELKASRVLGVVLNAVEELPVSHSYYGYSHNEADKDRDAVG